MTRVITRHIAETATQQLLLEQGDIDVARNLGPDQVAALEDNPDIEIKAVPKGAIYYLGLNQKNEYLAKPEVRQALKYLVPYQELADTVLKGRPRCIRPSCPRASWVSSRRRRSRSMSSGPRSCSPRPGSTDGFSVTMDVRSISPVTGDGAGDPGGLGRGRDRARADPG